MPLGTAPRPGSRKGGPLLYLDVDGVLNPEAPLEGFAAYDFADRQVTNHRKQIREFYGFREPTVGDEDKLIVWLASDMCPEEMSRDRLRSALLTRCREQKIEPPTPGRVDRLLGAAEAMFERQFTETPVERLEAGAIDKLEELIVAAGPDPDDDGPGPDEPEQEGDGGESDGAGAGKVGAAGRSCRS